MRTLWQRIRTNSSGLGHYALYAILPIALLALTLSANAQGQQTKTSPTALTAEMQARIAALAKSFDYRQDGVTLALREVGFPPEDWKDGVWKDFLAWPPRLKLHAAYNSVRAASGDGKHFIEQIALRLAAQNEALRYDPELSFLKSAEATAASPAKFQFKKLDGQSALAELPPEVAKIVRALARYVGPRYALMRALGGTCCGLKEEEVGTILQRSPKVEEALGAFIQSGRVPPEIAERLARLQIDAGRSNDLVLYDKIFERSRPPLQALQRSYSRENYDKLVASVREDLAPGPVEAEWVTAQAVERLKKVDKTLADETAKSTSSRRVAAEGTRRDIDSLVGALAAPSPPFNVNSANNVPIGNSLGRGPSDGSTSVSNAIGGGGPGLSAGGGGSNSRRFRALERGAYGSPGGGGGAFLGMRRVPFGHGGVVFGAEVTGAPDLPKIVSLSFVPRIAHSATPAPDSEQWGHLVVIFADGTTGFSAPIRAEHALAAGRLVFELGTEKADHSVGFGLAGVENGGPGAVLTTVTEKGIEEETRGHGFLVNPAIAHLNLARQAMMVDGTGFVTSLSDDFLDAIKDKRTPDQIDAYRQWFRSSRGFYKFTDRPLMVVRGPDGLVTARPRPGMSVIDREVKHPNLFLDFQAFDEEDKPIEKLESPLSLTLPALFADLIAISPDFRSLNDFAEVLAIFRLAKQESASWYGGTENVPEKVYAYGSLFQDTANHYVFGPSVYALRASLLERVEQQARAVITDGPRTLIAIDDRVFASRKENIGTELAESLVDQNYKRLLATGKEDQASELASAWERSELSLAEIGDPVGILVDALKRDGRAALANQIEAEVKTIGDLHRGYFAALFAASSGATADVAKLRIRLKQILSAGEFNKLTQRVHAKASLRANPTSDDFLDALEQLDGAAEERFKALCAHADPWWTAINRWAAIWDSFDELP